MTETRQILDRLIETIDARKTASPAESYTAHLLSSGIEKCAKKFGEEAVETALAAMTGDRQHIASEAADVMYHLLVLLAASDVSFDQVLENLEARTSRSGHAEKASRSLHQDK